MIQAKLVNSNPQITSRTKIPIVGHKIGRLTVIDSTLYHTAADNHFQIKCRCDCGKEFIKRLDHFNKKRGLSSCKSCGIRSNRSKYVRCGNLSSLMYSSIKRNAKIRNLEFNVSIEYLWDLFEKQSGKCALSKIDISLEPLDQRKDKDDIYSKKISRKDITASLDRIDPEFGYTQNNVQWVHKAVNILKNSLTNSEFINICKSVAEANKDYKDNFEPSQLNGYMRRFLYKKSTRIKLEGATHSD